MLYKIPKADNLTFKNSNFKAQGWKDTLTLPPVNGQKQNLKFRNKEFLAGRDGTCL